MNQSVVDYLISVFYYERQMLTIVEESAWLIEEFLREV